VNIKEVVTMKLLFIGDSFLTGYGVRNGESWYDIVKNETPEDMINKGINGNTTTDILVRFHEDALSEKPDYAFIMAGTNDALCKRTANIIFNNVVEMINMSLDSGIIPIIMLQPLISVKMANEIWGMGKEDYQESLIILKRYRRLITEYCQDENIATIDFAKTITEDILQNQPSKVFIDGVHLTQEYHKAVADKFLYKFNYILLKKDPKDYIVS